MSNILRKIKNERLGIKQFYICRLGLQSTGTLITVKLWYGILESKQTKNIKNKNWMSTVPDVSVCHFLLVLGLALLFSSIHQLDFDNYYNKSSFVDQSKHWSY